jgi:hypothetical protein
MLENLLPEKFRAYMGHLFKLTLADETAVSLELVEVRILPSHLESLPSWRQAEAESLRPSPFAIVFRGPQEPKLNQQMYTLVHEQLGTLENLFLVPIDADGNGRYYEAVFN